MEDGDLELIQFSSISGEDVDRQRKKLKEEYFQIVKKHGSWKGEDGPEEAEGSQEDPGEDCESNDDTEAKGETKEDTDAPGQPSTSRVGNKRKRPECKTDGAGDPGSCSERDEPTDTGDATGQHPGETGELHREQGEGVPPVDEHAGQQPEQANTDEGPKDESG